MGSTLVQMPKQFNSLMSLPGPPQFSIAFNRRVRRENEHCQFMVEVITDYTPDAFALVSPDNLDFVHTHAGVYCEKQQLS